MPKKGNNIYLRKDGRWEGRYPKDKTNGKARYGYIFPESVKFVPRANTLNEESESVSRMGRYFWT